MLGKVGEILLDECVKGLSCFCFVHIAIELHDCHDQEHIAWARHHAAVKLKDADWVPIGQVFAYVKASWRINKGCHSDRKILAKWLGCEDCSASASHFLDPVLFTKLHASLVKEPFLIVRADKNALFRSQWSHIVIVLNRVEF